MKEHLKHNKENLNSKFTKEPGFTSPEGYFDAIEDNFSLKLLEEKIPSDSGFEIPSNYFENLENNIISKVELPKKGKLITLRSKIIRLIPVAAAITIFLFVGINFMFSKDTELSSDEIAVWFDNNINSISSDDLTSELDDLEIDDANLLDNIINENNLETYINANDSYLLLQDTDINLDEIN